MSSKKSFKWIRALPLEDATRQPGFFRYNLKPVRQLPTQIFNALAPGANQTIVRVFVPGSSWGFFKNIAIRCIYQMTIGPAGFAGATIPETIAITGAAGTAMLVSAPFTGVAGVYNTWIERDLQRADPNILVWDEGDVMAHNWANRYDAIQHVITVPALVPPFDYTSQIEIDLQVSIPVGPPNIAITCLFAEAFIEQGTNLGTLP
jgi:hypothetical protein